MSAQANRKRDDVSGDDPVDPSDDRVYETIGGILVEREAARITHGVSQRRIGAGIDGFDRRSSDGDIPGGWWIATEAAVEYDPREIYHHDLAGWRRERLPTLPAGGTVSLRPDWVCEIVSPSNWARDTVTKFRTLQAHGVPHYWIVDLEHGQLTVYRFGGKVYEVAAVAQPGEKMRLEPFEALELDVSVLMGLDPGALMPPVESTD